MRGRPRSFDRDIALEQAVAVFWNNGYEGTSLNDLQAAMNISRPSLYAAFGDKTALFREAVARYRATSGSIVARAMYEQPTACLAVEAMLVDSAMLFTSGENPRGCLVVTSAINCTPDCVGQEQEMSKIRQSTTRLIKDRLQRAVLEGELPSGTNFEDLAQFYAAILSGISIQARDGASRSQLLAVARSAMRSWPAPTPPG